MDEADLRPLVSRWGGAAPSYHVEWRRQRAAVQALVTAASAGYLSLQELDDLTGRVVRATTDAEVSAVLDIPALAGAPAALLAVRITSDANAEVDTALRLCVPGWGLGGEPDARALLTYTDMPREWHHGEANVLRARHVIEAVHGHDGVGMDTSLKRAAQVVLLTAMQQGHPLRSEAMKAYPVLGGSGLRVPGGKPVPVPEAASAMLEAHKIMLLTERVQMHPSHGGPAQMAYRRPGQPESSAAFSGR